MSPTATTTTKTGRSGCCMLLLSRSETAGTQITAPLPTRRIITRMATRGSHGDIHGYPVISQTSNMPIWLSSSECNGINDHQWLSFAQKTTPHSSAMQRRFRPPRRNASPARLPDQFLSQGHLQRSNVAVVSSSHVKGYCFVTV